MKDRMESENMKRSIIRVFSLMIMLMLVCCLAVGCKGKEEGKKDSAQTSENADEEKNDKTVIRVGGLSGPTSMGLVKLMEDAANGKTTNEYEFAKLSTDPATFVAPLAKGEIDIAAVPSNLASVIYNNTEGKVKVIALNTLCVLNIVERNESIKSISDLKNKTIYATGQGATPEYTLRYLLSKNDINPDSDVTINWCADTTQALSYISNDTQAIAMLPQPFVTVAMNKVEGLRIALDLNDEWDKINPDGHQITGVMVARTDFIEKHQDAVETFLEEYKSSIEYLDNNAEDGAKLIEKYEIVAAPIAQKALPNCHIVYMVKDEMKTSLSGFLSILNDMNPQSIGGKLPSDDFYY